MADSRGISPWFQPWGLGNEPPNRFATRELRMSEMSSSAKARALAVEAQIDVDHEILDGALNGVEDAIVNPLREGMFQAVTATPCALIIFGVSGDLTSRKLMPALYDLAMNSRLAEGFAIVGVSRRQWSDEQFRAEMRAAVETHSHLQVTDERWNSFAKGLFYVGGTFDEAAMYDRLKTRLDELDHERRTEGNRLFYLATPPSFYTTIIRSLGSHDLVERQDFYSAPRTGWSRIVVEKPIGHDIMSARELNHAISEVVSEGQVYRIDHYLGKETVQNALAFRFANVLFEPVWNQHYVDHMQITVAESLGVEDRAAYYEED